MLSKKEINLVLGKGLNVRERKRELGFRELADGGPSCPSGDER